VDELTKLVEEASGLERLLPIVLVDIELTSLRSGVGRRFCLEDDCRNTMKVQDAREDQAAKPGPHNRYRGHHSLL
jgi:hypothetical protein